WPCTASSSTSRHWWVESRRSRRRRRAVPRSCFPPGCRKAPARGGDICPRRDQKKSERNVEPQAGLSGRPPSAPPSERHPAWPKQGLARGGDASPHRDPRKVRNVEPKAGLSGRPPARHLPKRHPAWPKQGLARGGERESPPRSKKCAMWSLRPVYPAVPRRATFQSATQRGLNRGWPAEGTRVPTAI